MLEETLSAIPSSSSIWASINAWFTPTYLFLLLNLVIASIAFTSAQKHKNPQNAPHPPPTSLLHRLKSINLHSHFRSQQPTNQNPSTHVNKPDPDSYYFFQDTAGSHSQTHFDSTDFGPGREQSEQEQSMDEVYSQMSRTKSDTEPAGGVLPPKLPARMRKSASLKSAFGHLEEEEIVEARRPASVRERGKAKMTEDDVEVDAKADDFINRFKQQLKLQRVESVFRYDGGE